MIELTYEQKQTIGYLYVTELLAPCSPYGQEKLRNLVPYTRDEADRLQQELDNLEALVKNRAETKSALNELMHVFMRMKHVGNALRRLRERPLTDVEFFECKNFLICTESAKKLTDALAGKIGLSGLRYEDTSEALALLDPDGRRIPSFAVYDSYSDKLRDIREQKRAIERKMEGSDADTWEKLKQERASLVMAEEQEEQQVRIRLTEDLRPFADRMKANTLVTADIDLLMEKARIASAKGAVRPVITTDALSFTNVRNPEVEAILSEKRLPFTPLSIALGTGAGLITGANMGGKSVALNTVTLNVYLALCGFFVFADAAQVPFFDQIMLLSEDMQSVRQSLSSFGADVVQMKHVLDTVEKEFCFVVLDEFARGTNPDEGTALVRAVTRYLNERDVIALIVTHYDGIAPYGNAHYQVAGLKDLDMERVKTEIAASGSTGVDVIAAHMNYGICPVSHAESTPKDAFRVCRLLGLQEEVLRLAEESAG